ncbi:MAG: hypothetical protein GY762_23605 [Proteobacteria bacterium]|nr:hypothetical protein [Pseudomonadota bacterium]
MKYSTDQFKPGEAWLVFLIESLVQNQIVHIYCMMDVASTYVFGNIMAPEELPDSVEVSELMQNAFHTKKRWPKKLFFPQQDPAEGIFRTYAEENSITFEVTSLSNFENIIAPYKKLFSQHFH